jgi:hypothetical protein
MTCDVLWIRNRRILDNEFRNTIHVPSFSFISGGDQLACADFIISKTSVIIIELEDFTFSITYICHIPKSGKKVLSLKNIIPMGQFKSHTYIIRILCYAYCLTNQKQIQVFTVSIVQ